MYNKAASRTQWPSGWSVTVRRLAGEDKWRANGWVEINGYLGEMGNFCE